LGLLSKYEKSLEIGVLCFVLLNNLDLYTVVYCFSCTF